MKELIDKLRALDNLDDLAGIADELDQSFTDFSAGSEASTNDLNTQITDLKAEIQRLQAENYKLLTANGEKIEDTQDNDPTGDSDEVIDNIDDVIEQD